MRRVLVANRGEIAVRIIATCRRLGIETVLACSAADRDSLAAERADRAVVIGPAPAAQSYLNAPVIVQAALSTGCDALHPGYGFLSERPELATLCEQHGVTFIGPTAETIRQLGDKLEARRLADAARTPRMAGSGALRDASQAIGVADELGYPVLLKAAAGGGGRGMAIAQDAGELRSVFPLLVQEAAGAFGDGTLYLERFIRAARHVEVQAIGDGGGTVHALGERDCSVQRRYQKVIEEAPAAALPDATRARLIDGAVALLASVQYRGAGTVEFLYDPERDEVSFIEVNTRIQVEHPVTEEVTGHDIVALQLAVAAGESLPAGLGATPIDGHAIELRINAEDPDRGFAPSPGRITRWRAPTGPGIRLDTFCREGTLVSPYYDSLLGKLIVHAGNRPHAVALAAQALDALEIDGIATNVALLQAICAHPDFIAGDLDTRWLERELLAPALHSNGA